MCSLKSWRQPLRPLRSSVESVPSVHRIVRWLLPAEPCRGCDMIGNPRRIWKNDEIKRVDARKRSLFFCTGRCCRMCRFSRMKHQGKHQMAFSIYPAQMLDEEAGNAAGYEG